MNQNYIKLTSVFTAAEIITLSMALQYRIDMCEEYLEDAPDSNYWKSERMEAIGLYKKYFAGGDAND